MVYANSIQTPAVSQCVSILPGSFFLRPPSSRPNKVHLSASIVPHLIGPSVKDFVDIESIHYVRRVDGIPYRRGLNR